MSHSELATIILDSVGGGQWKPHAYANAAALIKQHCSDCHRYSRRGLPRHEQSKVERATARGNAEEQATEIARNWFADSINTKTPAAVAEKMLITRLAVALRSAAERGRTQGLRQAAEICAQEAKRLDSAGDTHAMRTISRCVELILVASPARGEAREEAISDEVADEVQRRMDAVVDAAVRWREEDDVFGEGLEAAVDSLLELRDPPTALAANVEASSMEP